MIRQPIRRRWLQALTCTAVAAVAVGLAAQPAAAATTIAWIYHGSDKGRLLDNGQVSVCDNEADGRGVYVELQAEYDENHQFTDTTGSDGVCVVHPAKVAAYHVEWIKICERINNLPDACGSKVYISWGD